MKGEEDLALTSRPAERSGDQDRPGGPSGRTTICRPNIGRKFHLLFVVNKNVKALKIDSTKGFAGW